MNAHGLLRNACHALLALTFSAGVHALTDISSVPLNTYNAPSSSDVKPNIMFILDNSGSMSWDYMPDTVNNWNSTNASNQYTQYGQVSSQCNGVYYNPAITYKPPVDSTGTSYSNASFTAAWIDGYKTSSGSYNLSNNFDGRGVAAYYYRYTGTQTTNKLKDYNNTNSTFYKECNSTIGATPGSAVFTKVTVGASEQQNFANWYSYYRTRMLMMKTASGWAFKGVDDRFRVGFMTINTDSTTDFLNIVDFTTANKSTWYTALYAGKGSNMTPLRTALSDAGRMYAGQASSINGVSVTNPVQYSCQQNYTILSTDGFWNSGLGYQLNGSTEVGNEDAALPRPYYDGGSAAVQQRTSNLQQRDGTPQWTKQTSTLQTRTYTSTPAPANQVVNQLQARTSSDWGGSWSSWSENASCSVDNSGKTRTQCQTVDVTQVPKSTSSDSGVTWTPWFYANSCTVDNSGGNRTKCSGSVDSWSAWSNATGTCTASATTQCQYTTWSSPATVGSCTAVAQSASSPYTVLAATQCTPTTPLWGTWNSASSCTTSSTTGCQYSSWSSWATVASCTPLAQSSSSPYTVSTATECQTVSSGGSTDSLADVAAYYYNTDLHTPALMNCTGPVIPPATTASDLCADNVPANGRDVASWQHMTTFTVGLGVRGRMVYSPTYWSDTSGDFWDVWKGTTTNSAAGICSWQTSGACNWPGPSSGAIENVDDLWHASVNGHGDYYNASDPDALTTGLTSLLTTIINTPRPGTAAAAASSNPNISSSDNYVFSSSYKSVEWYGELIRQQIDASTGALSAQQWSAMTQLDTKVDTNVGNSHTNRTIYFNKSGALTPFLWNNLPSAQQAYFQAPYLTYTSATAGLSQFCPTGGNCLSSTAQTNTTVATNGAAGENLINFLRGDRTNELSFYRTRVHVLGDIVSSEARYVSSPTGMVYVAANDGMLHAFSAATGDENWAYIPSFVLPNLYKLADKNYSNQHQFFVDGSPEVATINSGAKTILVGGLNAGGKGYYALNITDPAHPALLWEYTDADMGYTYGNPRITKLGGTGSDAGKWVVIVTSGYNNGGPGYLYVLDANTGALLKKIAAGSTANSGLARISAHVVSSTTDNTVKAVYGGDLLGNLWRFDVNGNIGATGYDAQLLVSLKDAGGNAEPITAKPTIATVNGAPVVYIGTGVYLGVSDIASTSQQSFYAIKDKYDATTYGNPRTASNNFIAQTLTSTTCPADAPITVCTSGQTVRTVSASDCHAMDWNSKNGWYVDFLTGGERSTTDSALGLGTLVFTTNIPNQASASACGTSTSTDTSASFAYAVDYETGCSVQGSGAVAAVSLGIGLVTKPILGRLADGTVIAIIRKSGGNTPGGGTDLGGTVVLKPPIKPPGSGSKRVSWRELITE
ncbi:MAG: PilC/PilY family type IV pilus protein [Sulfuricellaceae bacterium]